MPVAPLDRASQHHEQKIAAGVWGTLLLAVVLAITSIVAMRAVVRSLSAVAFEDASNLIRTQELRIAVEVKGRLVRGYLLMGDDLRLAGLREAEQSVTAQLADLRATMAEDERPLVDRVERGARAYQTAVDDAVTLKKSAADPGRVQRAFDREVQPARDELDRAVVALKSAQEKALRSATREAHKTVSVTVTLLSAIAGAALVLALVLSVRLGRAIRAEQAHRAEVARHVARVEELNRELDAFAGRISHDLLNLLAPVRIGAATVLRASGSPDRVEAAAQRIARCIERCVAMLDGLLLFSRSGRPDPRATCSVRLVVDEVLEPLRSIAEKSDIHIACEAQALEVACSRALLNVVVSNLVGNALKFLSDCPQRDLRITAAAVDGRCEIVVADTGPGIPEEAKSRLFEPFYRVPGTKAPGTGIGLATVARIVSAHGGTIDVESTPGCGATFRVRLPLAAGDVASAA